MEKHTRNHCFIEYECSGLVFHAEGSFISLMLRNGENFGMPFGLLQVFALIALAVAVAFIIYLGAEWREGRLLGFSE